MSPLRLVPQLVAALLVVGGLSVVGSPASAAAGTITGHVTDSGGDPVAGASVTLYTRLGTLWIQAGTTSTDAAGAYDTSALSLDEEEHRVRFSADGYATEYYDDARVLRRATSVAPTGGVVDAQLTTAATVTGMVTDDAGAPVVGARVSVLQWDAVGKVWDVVAETTAGPAGYAVGVAPGAYQVRAEANALPVGGGDDTYGYGTRSYQDGAAFVVPVGGVSGIDLRFGPLTQVSGVVSDDDDHPIGGITVSASGSCGEGCGLTPVASTRTAADGTYTLRAVPGSYAIRFDDQDGAAWFEERWADGAPITVGAAGVDGISPRLSAARTIAGRVAVDGTARGFVRVSVWPEGDTSGAEEDAYTRFTGSDGSYAVTVPEGSYRVRFRDAEIHRCEYYAGAATQEVATIVEVGGGNRTGIDANLTAADAGSCTGADPGRRIANVRRPVVTGTLQVGQVLTVTPGLWEPGDVDVQSYVWTVGDAIVATGAAPTYLLRPGDVGRSVVVQEVVTAAGFTEPGFAESAARGPVTDPAACASATAAVAGASAAATVAATGLDVATAKAAKAAKKLKKLKKAGAAKPKVAKARKRAKAARKALAGARSEQAAATAALAGAQAAVPAGC
ncbi:carboxypeptidase-like regulatory domain-containing protein [Nocardioides sp. LHD-245]|uniref:carboxypeptidase-like regulatory domain-containing protein n=1 Tax=Nocardioides sp. LHD-245 TaxID=3051387 RepID=UPI0027DFC536|nr:carboxypeptidase-like regulatory domain-containing protein [Nocardioides sp. LHD-245]